MNKFVLKIIEVWRNPTRYHRLMTVSGLSVLFFLAWGFVYMNGGTTHAYVHLMYIPIILASFFWGIVGGLLSAIVAGILVGPFMPLDVDLQTSQPVSSMLLRMVFFILVSLVVGYISTLLKRYIIFADKTFEQLSSTYANTLRNYAKMVSVRDEQTSHHCERVAYNSRLVGMEYGMSEQQSEALYWAGLLHDVGKIGVKEEILLKPGKLTTDEYKEIQKHTVVGYDLITSLSRDLSSVGEGVRSHHEKWNGEGYPDRLKEDEIPLFGRIITVVDVFEALTASRPYKDSWSSEDALNFLIEQKGVSFDPVIVDIFARLFDSGKIWVYDKPIVIDESVVPLNFQVSYHQQLAGDV